MRSIDIDNTVLPAESAQDEDIIFDIDYVHNFRFERQLDHFGDTRILDIDCIQGIWRGLMWNYDPIFAAFYHVGDSFMSFVTHYLFFVINLDFSLLSHFPDRDESSQF